MNKALVKKYHLETVLDEVQSMWPALSPIELLTLGLRSLNSLSVMRVVESAEPNFSQKERHDEKWKSLRDFPGCSVSNLGRIGGVSRDTFKIRKISRQTGGYGVVFLQSRQVQVSRLVAENFIRKSKSGEIVNHLNSNKLDNRASNLEWTTQKKNIEHSNKHGLRERPTRKFLNMSAYTKDEIRKFHRRVRKGLLAKIYGIKSSEMALICAGE